MLIAQFGHFWESAAEEWLDPESTDAERVHAEGRVAELMDPPLSVDLLGPCWKPCADLPWVGMFPLAAL